MFSAWRTGKHYPAGRPRHRIKWCLKLVCGAAVHERISFCAKVAGRRSMIQPANHTRLDKAKATGRRRLVPGRLFEMYNGRIEAGPSAWFAQYFWSQIFRVFFAPDRRPGSRGEKSM